MIQKEEEGRVQERFYPTVKLLPTLAHVDRLTANTVLNPQTRYAKVQHSNPSETLKSSSLNPNTNE